MNLDKENIKKIILIIVLAMVALWAALNFKLIGTLILYLIALFSPLLLGFCIAFVINVVLRVIEDKGFVFIDRAVGLKRANTSESIHSLGRGAKIWNGFRRPLSIIISLGIIFGIVYFVFRLVIPELNNTIEMMAAELPGYMEKKAVLVVEFLNQHDISSVTVQQVMEQYTQLKTSVVNLIKNIFIGSVGILDSAINATISVFSGLFNFVMGIVFSIYILLKKETLGRQAKQLLFAHTPRKVAEEVIYIAKLSHKTFSNFVTGQCFEAVIIGALCFIGMSIFKMPYAAMISVMVGFTALIPVFGAFIGTAIGAFLILMVNPIQALWFILFIIVLQQLEGNLIYPNVVGNSVGLPSMWVMLAVLVGGSLKGVVGMLFAVPVSAVLYVLLARITKKRLEEKQIDIDSI